MDGKLERGGLFAGARIEGDIVGDAGRKKHLAEHVKFKHAYLLSCRDLPQYIPRKQRHYLVIGKGHSSTFIRLLF